ncbi:YvcK family protein [Candidatus Gottesmanbacteria bacterium]|nr:YvcK family protein [Candidatus Gottesmanbacteria bacterium]
MKKHLKYVCLGGGIGTVNVLRGIKDYSKDISVLVSMADDGGSAGRLRRLFSIPPPGDLMNCIAALSDAEPMVRDLLTYRFKGNRWGRDDSLGGQKLGNLMLVALSNLTGSFEKGLEEAQRLFLTHGRIIPATKENVSIWALTVDGKKINGEENIDLGKYNGTRSLTEVHLEPKNPTTSKIAVNALNQAEVMIAGPGDLYTTMLPVLLVPEVKKALFRSKAKKIFVVNVANKPFETPNYMASDFITAVIKHIGAFPFDYILINDNFDKTIPKRLKYTYVLYNKTLMPNVKSKVVQKNLVNESFPLYHDPKKLGKTITDLI